MSPPVSSLQETSAPPGEIQLSKATADKLRAPWPGGPTFELVERGPMQIKGKGEMVRPLSLPKRKWSDVEISLPKAGPVNLLTYCTKLTSVS